MDEPSETPEPEKKPPGKPSKKADNGTVAARVEEVLRLRLEGCELHDIRKHSEASGWGITERQVRTYIERADDLLAERRENRRKRLIARHMAQRQDLYRRCLITADYRTALATLADLAKLGDLYPDKKLKELAAEVLAMRAQFDQLVKQEENRVASIPPPLAPTTGGTDPGPACSV